MTNLPALPEGIDPKARFVEMRAFQCQHCGEMGPAVDTSDKNNLAHLWDSDHAKENPSHGRKFWAWTLQRSHAELYYI
jgi:hypothetical protein